MNFSRHIATFALALLIALPAIPVPAQEIELDLSEMPKGEWVRDTKRNQARKFFGEGLHLDKISDEEIWVFVPPKSEPYPKEWDNIKSFEEEGELPLLTISKKELEAEGEIFPLGHFTAIKDPAEIDRAAMHRSLLHHALTQAGIEAIAEHRPANMKKGAVPGAGEVSEHYGGIWPRKKMYYWLAADILSIDYMLSRPEDHWKTGALCAANDLLLAISTEQLGPIKETFAVGSAVVHHYLVPLISYSLPPSSDAGAPYTTTRTLLEIWDLYKNAGRSPEWYPNIFDLLLSIEENLAPSTHVIHSEMIANIYLKRGEVERAIRVLKNVDLRAPRRGDLAQKLQDQAEALRAETHETGPSKLPQ